MCTIPTFAIIITVWNLLFLGFVMALKPFLFKLVRLPLELEKYSKVMKMIDFALILFALVFFGSIFLGKCPLQLMHENFSGYIFLIYGGFSLPVSLMLLLKGMCPQCGKLLSVPIRGNPRAKSALNILKTEACPRCNFTFRN